MRLPRPLPEISQAARHVGRHPLAFARQTFESFNRNQGLLLAGAIAYYALLSVLPLLILWVIALSHLVDQAELLATLGRYLEWLVPSQSRAVLADLEGFLEHRAAIGAVLLFTLLFFSSLAFSVLEKAMAVIFADRAAAKPRHFLVSALLPYCFVLLLGGALLGVTLAASIVQSLAEETVRAFGHSWSLRGVSGVLLYLLGLGLEIFLLAALYLIVPVGRVHLRHALVGGCTAAVLWEIVRHLLVWYFSGLSKVSVVYGSLSTAVVTLFSFEIGALLFLFGAQVIAEYQRVGGE